MYVPHLVYALAVGGNFMVPALPIGSFAAVIGCMSLYMNGGFLWDLELFMLYLEASRHMLTL